MTNNNHCIIKFICKTFLFGVIVGAVGYALATNEKARNEIARNAKVYSEKSVDYANQIKKKYKK